MATIFELLSEARSKLTGPEVTQESEILLTEICGISRSHQFSHPDEPLSAEQVQQYQLALQRRLAGMPLAYIIGCRGFWDMDLKVNSDVLIPRPDTECLVEQALQRIPAEARWQVADLGTGSGAIALALAREREYCEIIATDISARSLVVAKENARQLGVQNIQFVTGSWTRPLAASLFDMIVSNPPYICSDDPHLQQGDLPAEPQTALVSGPDGLDAIRLIISGSLLNLKAGGHLLLEHGYEQAGAVRGLMLAAGFKSVFSQKDYAGNDRVTGGSMRV